MAPKRLLDKADSTLATELSNRTDLTPSEALDLPREELEAKLLDAMPIEELRELPEVKANEHVRRNLRSDVISAARGELVEKEREEATRKAVEQENKRAPSEEDVHKLLTPPSVDVQYGEDGSTVEAVIVRQFVLGEDGRPELVEETHEA